uniref:Tc1-like transposase DDE domain-containing protein n=1 Tax=Denticeps clupeoides TaxID=299321 RepID=A0AAY4BW59_9TELE
MNAAKDRDILDKNLLQNNDPKHTANEGVASQQSVTVLEWPSQSPDLNPIENLWRDLKMAVHQARQPKNLTKLHQLCKEEWAYIPLNYCEMLLEGYPKRLSQVIQFKGNSTKY